MTGQLNTISIVGTGNVRTSGTVTAGDGGNFLQMNNAATLVARNTVPMRFGFASDINGVGYTERMVLTQSGTLQIPGNATVGNGITVTGNTTFNSGVNVAGGGANMVGNVIMQNWLNIGTNATPNFPLHIQTSTTSTSRIIAFLKLKSTLNGGTF
jgi:hypothetical protein